MQQALLKSNLIMQGLQSLRIQAYHKYISYSGVFRFVYRQQINYPDLNYNFFFIPFLFSYTFLPMPFLSIFSRHIPISVSIMTYSVPRVFPDQQPYNSNEINKKKKMKQSEIFLIQYSLNTLIFFSTQSEILTLH